MGLLALHYVRTGLTLTQQRDKILAFALEFLLHSLVAEMAVPLLYKGYRLLAGDGTDLHTPTNPLEPENFFQTQPAAKGFNRLHLGIASNHGDIRNWQVLFGDNMDKLRADVQAMLDGGVPVPEPVEPVEPPTTDQPIAAAVQTGSFGQNMREGPGTSYKSLGTIPRGKSLDVYEIRGTWARVRYQDTVCWVSANFLTIDFLDVDPEEPAQAPIGIAVQDKEQRPEHPHGTRHELR